MVSGAHAVGELARHGVPAGDAMPLGLAIARHGPRPAAEIAGLFEEWRAEGGKDARSFVAEAAARIEKGQGLAGMVDVFGESPDRLNAKGRDGKQQDQDDVADRDATKHGSGKGNGPGERADKAGAPARRPGQTLNLKCSTSPSWTRYSFPSTRMRPRSRAAASLPRATSSATGVTSALMKPRSKSLWMTPAA